MNLFLNESKMFADVSDGIAIVINSLTGIYYGMNQLGTVVFQNLCDGASTEDILAALKALPEAPGDSDEKFSAFIDSLLSYEIMTSSEEASHPVQIDGSVAAADNFTPLCTEYKDVQELLFADPIHEVDVDEGWKPE